MAKPRIATAAGRIKESRIRRLTVEAMQYQAVSLAQAFPDYAPPAQFVDAIRAACTSSQHQYTDTWGARTTRGLVAAYVTRFHPRAVPDPDVNVLVTIGAMEAMNDALFVALDPGDEVIVIEPFYECFVAQILSRHGVPRFVPMRVGLDGRFELDPSDVDRAFSPRTRAVLINTPGNPSGAVLTHAEIEALLEICRRHGAWLISDETYDQIYFTEERPASVADVDPAFEQSVLVSGFGKTFAVTGWRIGYLIGNEEFIRHVRPPHDVNTICAVSVVQEALPALVHSPDSYFSQMRAEYRRRFQILREGLESCGFAMNRVEGAYYVFATIPSWWPSSASDLNDALLHAGFVTGVPGSVFYGNGGGDRFIRYTFCKAVQSMQNAVERLAEGLNALRGVRT